jgi:hypothetical protein
MIFRAAYGNKRYAVRLLGLLGLCLFCFCNNPSTLGSGGTDFPNTRTVAGRILNADKSPGSHTEVRLFSQNAIPLGANGNGLVAVDSTDSSGYFTICFSDSATSYNLQAIHLQKRTRLFIRNVAPKPDTLHLEDHSLQAPGALLIHLPDTLDSLQGYLYLQGTSFSVAKNRLSSSIVFDSLPVGTTPAICFAGPDALQKHDVVRDSGVVVSAETTLVITKAWKYRLQVFFNTTPTGAWVTENVVHFPLALPFSALSFFSLASFRPDGSDLIVTRSDGKPLPIEIEQWDPARSNALVWVKMDTIMGNCNSQYINLYWAGPDSIVNPERNRVFDTADGFSAVWHLSGGCLDATVNKFNGTKQGQVTDTVGILGSAQRFHGNDYIAVNGLLDTPATLTLSAWAMLDTPNISGGEVVSIGDAALIRMDDGWNLKGSQGAGLCYPDKPDSLSYEVLASGRFFKTTGWHHFTYVFDRSAMQQSFYIDGNLCCAGGVGAPIHYSGGSRKTIMGALGNGSNYYNFIGSIDEVEVAHKRRSDSWIRLSYINQKTPNLLLRTLK